MARKKAKSYVDPEFANFYMWLLRKGYDEDLLNEVVDSAYNFDTNTFYITDELAGTYKRVPMAIPFKKAFEEVRSRAAWAIQSSTETKDVKKLRSLVAQYAKEHATHIVKNWKTLRG